MNDWGKPTQTDDLFVESTNTEDLRARRVWLFASVMSATWLFFAIFLWLRQFSIAAQECVLAFLVISLINFVYRKSDKYSRVMNLNLATSAVGLFSVSVSDPAMHGTMLFYPVSIVVSSQLLGVRSALLWFCINLFAMTGFFLCVDGFEGLFSSTRFDELVLLLGVAACIYFCCYQGEEYYRRRTDGLINLSQYLQSKSDTLHTLATTDALTGLINRFQFQERLRHTVQASIETSSPMAVFMIDMNGFKEINDTLGHPIGDAALVSIANLLVERFGGDTEVARLGGDEFCLLKTDLRSPEDADEIARAAVELLTHRCVLLDTSFPLSASVGYCLVPEHATTGKDALAFADTAMFHAKDHRIGCARYEREMTEKLVEYRTVQEKLSLALQRDEFFLVYQPQVCLDTGVVTGVEALLRWRCDGEIVPPVQFIHLLERSREILPVSNWIIHQACRQLALWDAEGFSISMSVNVSALQFADPDFYATVVDAIETFGVDPRQLDFEITEGLLIDDVDAAVGKLKQLKDLGASISIDDFGTGYSSLAYLRQFPIDRLKIDRAFIKDYPDADDGMIATSIVVLAKSLGLKVLAEGVETEKQLEFLQYHGCGEYQGYFFSRPVSPEMVAERLTRVNQPSLMESYAVVEL